MTLQELVNQVSAVTCAEEEIVRARVRTAWPYNSVFTETQANMMIDAVERTAGGEKAGER